MPLFDADNRLKSDRCAVNLRDSQNLSMESYTFRDMRFGMACPGDLSSDECAQLQARLHSSDGYGVQPGNIDEESGLRCPSGGITHDKSRQGLASRVFEAAPDMGRGGLDANVESRLLLSGEQGTARNCAFRFAERSYNRFDPGVQKVAVENIVQAFPAGEPSRDIARSDAFTSPLGSTPARLTPLMSNGDGPPLTWVAGGGSRPPAQCPFWVP
ncbi:MAG: hypothetical protein WDW38_006551 [Sanguina aurantia]